MKNLEAYWSKSIPETLSEKLHSSTKNNLMRYSFGQIQSKSYKISWHEDTKFQEKWPTNSSHSQSHLSHLSHFLVENTEMLWHAHQLANQSPFESSERWGAELVHGYGLWWLYSGPGSLCLKHAGCQIHIDDQTSPKENGLLSVLPQVFLME